LATLGKQDDDDSDVEAAFGRKKAFGKEAPTCGARAPIDTVRKGS